MYAGIGGTSSLCKVHNKADHRQIWPMLLAWSVAELQQCFATLLRRRHRHCRVLVRQWAIRCPGMNHKNHKLARWQLPYCSLIMGERHNSQKLWILVRSERSETDDRNQAFSRTWWRAASAANIVEIWRKSLLLVEKYLTTVFYISVFHFWSNIYYTLVCNVKYYSHMLFYHYDMAVSLFEIAFL